MKLYAASGIVTVHQRVLLSDTAANNSTGKDAVLVVCLLPTALAWEVMQSLPSVCPSFRLFPFYLWNWLTVDLELLHASRS